MKTTTVRQLRHDFGTVLGRIEEGEEVEISKRGRVVARLVPPSPKRARRRRSPDFFSTRLQRIFGKQVPLPYNPVLRERDESRW